MKIAVIGAGVVGITTAYELARDGHEVTVFERRNAAAEESSFANAGVVAPGYVTPWAAPGMPAKVFRQLWGRHASVRLGKLSGADLAWLRRWWRACRPEIYKANRSSMQALALYSRERLHHIVAELKLEYDRSDGYLVLLRSEADRALVEPGLAVLRDAGLAFAQVDADAARQLEPGLSASTPLHAAIHLPQDEVGNCRQFALLLKAECQRQGVVFEFGQTVSRLETGQGVTLHCDGAAQGALHTTQNFDAAVACAGLGSAALLKPLGLNVPLAAVYGYSVSAPVREALNAPRSSVMDERYKVAITRLGNRVRVAGGAELGGDPTRHRAASIRTLYKVLHDWFPGGASLSSGVQVWKGARPMLPDGPPVIAASGHPGLWLNLGHGSSGWALSCGSARALADLVSGQSPDVDVGNFGLGRLA